MSRYFPAIVTTVTFRGEREEHTLDTLVHDDGTVRVDFKRLQRKNPAIVRVIFDVALDPKEIPMAYGEMRVKDMIKVLAGMPADAWLVIHPGDEDFTSCEPSRRREGGKVIQIPGRPASVWNYNTRFVKNIHLANDDRLDISQIVVIVIGEPLP